MVGLLGPDYRGMPLQERKRYVLLATRPKAMATTIDEHEQAVVRLPDAPSGALRNDLPLRILTHGVPWPDQEYEHLWQESQRQALTWSSRSKLIVAEQSGHAIMLAQPELVIEAIREIIEEARA
jgi:pimeloyl-ACP methyl ester carboxylesterase